MRRRLLLSYLGLAVVVLVVLEVPLGIVLGRRERDALTATAQREATALAVLAQEGLEHPENHDLVGLADRYRAQTNGEVTVVDQGGTPVAQALSREGEPASADVRDGILRALRGQANVGSLNDEGSRVVVAAQPIRADVGTVGAVAVALPASNTERRVHREWLMLAVFGVGVLAMSTLVGLGLARSVDRPLARLKAAAEQLGHGDLGVRAAIGGPVETVAVAEAFNIMASRLEELVDSQRRFVADASHQLRTPLTALGLRLEGLEAAATEAGGVDLEAARVEVSRLSRIVDGLLALARAEGARTDREPVDVAKVVAERQDAWAALAAERDVAMSLDIGLGAQRALLMPGHLEQVLDNLLANALDVTPGGRRVGISVASASGRVEIRVDDQGPGMSGDELERAFAPFWQASGRPSGGSGLGLAIVRQLVHANDGEVVLQPRATGGLGAVVSLPALAL
ncbi:MAG: sensor histidine kinase [Acidimicrobiales bacterium]